MSRHERKGSAMERKGPRGFWKLEKIPASMITDMQCAWAGCEAHFKFGDGMPKGWTWLYVYWSHEPKTNLLDIVSKDCLRDAALCPAHTQLLDSQLKELGRTLSQPVAGSA
jgi:hypothetical protein